MKIANYVSFLSILVLLVSVSACKGGGGGGGGGDAQAPKVSTVSPQNNLAQVSVDTSIIALFSEQMDAKTIDDSSFLLASPKGEIPGAVSYNKDNFEARFATMEELALQVKYKATITKKAKDLAGNPLPADFSWNFTTRDGILLPEQLMETDTSMSAVNIQTYANANGDALFIWTEQLMPSGSNYWAVVYDADLGWGTTEKIASMVPIFIIPTTFVGDMDEQGNCFIAWEEWTDTNGDLIISGADFASILTRRYDAQTQIWSPAEIVDTVNDRHARRPILSADKNGNAFMLWMQQIDLFSDQDLLISRYDMESDSWGSPVTLEGLTTIDIATADLTVDSNGNALAVWSATAGASYDLYANFYDNETSTWSAEEMLEDDPRDAFGAKAAFLTSGRAVVIWPFQDSFDMYSMAGNMWIPGFGWEGHAQWDTDLYSLGSPAYFLEVDTLGNAFAAWRKINSSGSVSQLQVLRYSSDEDSEELTSINGANSKPIIDNFNLQTDHLGRALVVFAQIDTVPTETELFSCRFTPDSGWEAPVLVDGSAGTSAWPKLAVDENGNAMMLWDQVSGGMRDLWFARYRDGLGWEAPENLRLDTGATFTIQKTVWLDRFGRGGIGFVPKEAGMTRIYSRLFQ